MSYYQKQYYNTPDPEELDDNDVEILIDTLKKNIDAEKIKNMKSALSKLKLAINKNYPLFTRTTATFGAYVYAVKSKKKKAIKSLLNAALKKNYSFMTFPLEKLMSNLTNSEMKIVINDILLQPTCKWHLEGFHAIKKMLQKFPDETAELIEKGKLNKYEKGDERVETTKTIIQYGNEKAAVGALNTFFGKEYLDKYGIHPNKLQEIMDVVDVKNPTFKKKLREDFFYTVAAKSISAKFIENEYKTGKIDKSLIKKYVSSMIEKSFKNELVKLLEYLTESSLSMIIITADESFMNLVLENHTSAIPKIIHDIFLF